MKRKEKKSHSRIDEAWRRRVFSRYETDLKGLKKRANARLMQRPTHGDRSNRRKDDDCNVINYNSTEYNSTFE